MAITIGDDGVIFDGLNPIVFPEDGNYRPSAFLSGFDVNDNIVLGRFTTDGRLRVDAEITIGDLTIGDVGLLLTVGAGAQLLSGILNPDSSTYAGYVQDQRMSFTGGNLNVNASVTIPSGIATSALQITGNAILSMIASDLTDGSAVVTVSSPGQDISTYGEELAVASNSTVTVVSYTVPSAKTFYLKRIDGTGENIGVYVTSANSSVIGKRRTCYTEYNVEFEYDTGPYDGLKFVAGDVIEMDVTNEGSSAAEFNGTIYGRLV